MNSTLALWQKPWYSAQGAWNSLCWGPAVLVAGFHIAPGFVWRPSMAPLMLLWSFSLQKIVNTYSKSTTLPPVKHYLFPLGALWVCGSYGGDTCPHMGWGDALGVARSCEPLEAFIQCRFGEISISIDK